MRAQRGQNVLLGIRQAGLGSTLTTILVTKQTALRALLGIPDQFLLAAHLAVGWPARPHPRRLRRHPVEQFATVEHFDGPPLR